MECILTSCAGMDVHEIKTFSTMTFSTMTSDLLKLREWLKGYGVTAVAMESTGIYLKPIFNILEDEFDVVLANAQHIKTIPGKKSDIKDCQWIAVLLRHGLVPRSFIPPERLGN
jgi:transposase